MRQLASRSVGRSVGRSANQPIGERDSNEAPRGRTAGVYLRAVADAQRPSGYVPHQLENDADRRRPVAQKGRNRRQDGGDVDPAVALGAARALRWRGSIPRPLGESRAERQGRVQLEDPALWGSSEASGARSRRRCRATRWSPGRRLSSVGARTGSGEREARAAQEARGQRAPPGFEAGRRYRIRSS